MQPRFLPGDRAENCVSSALRRKARAGRALGIVSELTPPGTALAKRPSPAALSPTTLPSDSTRRCLLRIEAVRDLDDAENGRRYFVASRSPLAARQAELGRNDAMRQHGTKKPNVRSMIAPRNLVDR
jgi:hypothetical protein